MFKDRSSFKLWFLMGWKDSWKIGTIPYLCIGFRWRENIISWNVFDEIEKLRNGIYSNSCIIWSNASNILY